MGTREREDIRTEADGDLVWGVDEDSVKEPCLVACETVLGEGGVFWFGGGAEEGEYDGDAAADGLGAVEEGFGGCVEPLDGGSGVELAGCFPGYDLGMYV